jgi:hypothetical protein
MSNYTFDNLFLATFYYYPKRGGETEYSRLIVAPDKPEAFKIAKEYFDNYFSQCSLMEIDIEEPLF